MSIATFEERLARIARQPASAKPILMAGPGPVEDYANSVRRGYGMIVTGVLFGLADAVALQGLVLALSPWGPGSGLGNAVGVPAIGVMLFIIALAFCTLVLRRKRPARVGFSIAAFLALVVGVSVPV